MVTVRRVGWAACLLVTTLGVLAAGCGGKAGAAAPGVDGGPGDDGSPPVNPEAGPSPTEPCGCPYVEPTWTGTEAGIAVVDARGGLLVIVHANDGAGDAFTLERRTSATALDTSFGDQGKVTLTGTPLDMAVGASGTIAIVLSVASDAETLLALDATGARLAGFDATAAFTSMGLSVVPQSPWNNHGMGGYDVNYNPKQRSMAFQPDGTLLLVATGDHGPVVLRLATDGSVDTTFGTQGYLTVSGTFAWDIALLPSGDFVLVTQDDTAGTITAAWYSGAGVALGPTAPIRSNSYDGILARSDGTLLIGTALGSTTTFAAYSAQGGAANGPGVQIPSQDHRFIGPMDALTYVPATSAALTVGAFLPNGTAEANVQATCAVPAGDSLLFLNAIADGTGGLFLLGETCGAIDTSDETLACTALVAQLSASGVLTQ